MNVIQQIELESTFDALGFFKIELSTLTSLGSTILTYLIILAQFNSSPPSTDQLTEIIQTIEDLRIKAIGDCNDE